MIAERKSWAETLRELRGRLPGASGGPVRLFSFTIAGIQDFLAASRTTRDVWNGSYMLSWLSFKAAEAVCRQISSNPTAAFNAVIFPDFRSQPFAGLLQNPPTQANPE